MSTIYTYLSLVNTVVVFFVLGHVESHFHNTCVNDTKKLKLYESPV